MYEGKSIDGLYLKPEINSSKVIYEYEFPSIKVGVAEYNEGPTGCTVLYFPKTVRAAVDVRGGSPSTFTTDNHNFSSGERILDAICLTGGSVHGLEAVTGVTSELLALSGYSTHSMPRVAAATIYDFVGRDNAIYPDKRLGRAAFLSAQINQFPLGAVGAGRSAKVGKGYNHWETGGQGAAYRQVGPTKIIVFTVVNPMGAIVGRDGSIVRGYYDNQTHTRYMNLEHLMDDSVKNLGNTTLTVVVTNQKLPAAALRQLSKQIHTSMARAIYPFHTIDDGDVLFMASTNEVDNPELNAGHIGLLASELAWDAVLRSFEG
ncbi:P1 family peptidase [Paenibacillus sp. GCM10027626]|uniref:P1 family peptidase n=1 Tax=Paenibacillus sp. GCM10027626 TaxID=3273411 RepID=UPI00363EFE57